MPIDLSLGEVAFYDPERASLDSTPPEIPLHKVFASLDDGVVGFCGYKGRARPSRRTPQTFHLPTSLNFFLLNTMHNESKMITFMCGENVCGPLMLACMSECSDMPLACIMMDMGMNDSCMGFTVVCDPSRGMMMVMPMGASMMPMSGCPMPMGFMMMPMSCSNPMMGSCMYPTAMGARGNASVGVHGPGHCMGAGGNAMGMGMGGNSMGMHMMSPMMRTICPMMSSGRNMMHEGMGNKMCMMMGRQDMMNMSKLVLLKLDPMSACMDMCDPEVIRNAMKAACPIWQCRLEHMRGCATVMISRNPMTHEICAMEHDSGRGMMMGCGEQRMGGMLTMMMPMRSKL